MARKSGSQDLNALKRMLEQADMSFALIRDPNAYVKRGREALKAAIELSKHLATENPAAKLGAKGGQKTAERGSEHFKQLAAMRKTKAGGRPRKNPGQDPVNA